MKKVEEDGLGAADDVQPAGHIASQIEQQVPALYQVLIYNDDFTPIEFVVGALERFFYMERQQAVTVTLEIHSAGSAVCGTYSKDVAESKLAQVMDFAKVHQHPLAGRVEAVCN